MIMLLFRCRHCYKDREKKVPNSNMNMEDALQRTIFRKEIIEALGYQITEMWGCEWEALKKAKKEIRDFLKNFNYDIYLKPRDALCGGRTNAISLYRKAEGREKIKYLDVCSLYPWACKYGTFPIGHPVQITENFERITAGNRPYFGLICCEVEAPRGLFHPVLPYKWGNRLNFPLCRSCLESEFQGKCGHDSHERSFVGTFTSVELYKVNFLFYILLRKLIFYSFLSIL